MTVLAKVLAKALAADLALAAFIGFALALSQIPLRAQSVADFYRGKSIDLNIGYSVGGGYDLYARLIARRLGGHIRQSDHRAEEYGRRRQPAARQLSLHCCAE